MSQFCFCWRTQKLYLVKIGPNFAGLAISRISYFEKQGSLIENNQKIWKNKSCVKILTQIYIPIPNRKSCEMYEILAFCRKNGWIMQNLWLDSDRAKILADPNTKNTLNYLTTYPTDLPSRAKYLGYLKKKTFIGCL